MQTITIKCIENKLNQNTYLVEFENCCVVIDAGCSLNEIKQQTQKPITAVFITHGHFDHILNIEEYNNLNIPIYASKHINQMLENATNNASIYFDSNKTFKLNNLNYVENLQEIKIENHKIQCLYTPGHTKDCMCYLIDNNLFSGDTVFAVAVGRDDLATANTNELINSLNLILNLDYKLLYSGHGAASDKSKQQINIPKWIKYLSRAGHKAHIN